MASTCNIHPFPNLAKSSFVRLLMTAISRWVSDAKSGPRNLHVADIAPSRDRTTPGSTTAIGSSRSPIFLTFEASGRIRIHLLHGRGSRAPDDATPAFAG